MVCFLRPLLKNDLTGKQSFPTWKYQDLDYFYKTNAFVMKDLFKAALTGFFAISVASSGFSQSRDSIRNAKTHYFQKKLSVDAGTAYRASTLIDTYKARIKAVWKIKSMAEKQKLSQIDRLITRQNQDLMKVLTKDQMARIEKTMVLERRDTVGH